MFTKMKYIIQKDIQGIIVDKAFTFSGTPSFYWLPNTVTGGCNDRVRTCVRAHVRGAVVHFIRRP